MTAYLWLAGGGLISTLSVVVWALIERARAVHAETAELTTLKQLGEVEARAADDKQRLEAVVAQYKTEVDGLLKDMPANPEAVRERLRKLLAGEATP